MVALDQTGVGRISRLDLVDQRGAEIVSKYQDFASDEGVFDDLFSCLRRNLNAKKSQRVEKPKGSDGSGAYSYEVVEDGMTQVAAARTLAQILRLMPQSAGVTVNNGPTNTLNVTTSDRLAELDAIGVPRAEIQKACADLLEASSVSVPAKDSQKG